MSTCQHILSALGCAGHPVFLTLMASLDHVHPVIVDQARRVPRSYRSVNEAIDKCAPNGVVVVYPGRYYEKICVTKPLRIQGCLDDPTGGDDSGQVVFEPGSAGESVLTFASEGTCVLSNLTFKQCGELCLSRSSRRCVLTNFVCSQIRLAPSFWLKAARSP